MKMGTKLALQAGKEFIGTPFLLLIQESEEGLFCILIEVGGVICPYPMHLNKDILEHYEVVDNFSFEI